jgi:hypothetical protein
MQSDLFVHRLDGGYELLHAQRLGKTLRMHYNVTVMPVYEHERDLDRGRFLFYSHEDQEYVVQIRRDENHPIPWKLHCEPWVNWIAEHHQNPWSLRIEMENVHAGTFVFSFSDPTIAFMFKLAHG